LCKINELCFTHRKTYFILDKMKFFLYYKITNTVKWDFKTCFLIEI
jgi:hypothetical protein